jgi:hypothetical protein
MTAQIQCPQEESVQNGRDRSGSFSRIYRRKRRIARSNIKSLSSRAGVAPSSDCGVRNAVRAPPRRARSGAMTAAERFAIFAGALSAALTLAIVAGLAILLVVAP